MATRIDTPLSALGVRLPGELLERLDIEEYLDGLDHEVALAAGERRRLGALLLAAEHITATQLDEALSEQQRGGRKLGEVLVEQGVLTEWERDVVLEFQRRETSVAAETGKHALGNILVAGGQINRAQLEDALRRQLKSGQRLGEELVNAGHASKGQVESGLMLQRKLVACALAVTVGLMPLAVLVPSAEAAQKSAIISVSVHVIANAKMQTTFQAEQLNITAADVARGYVEVSAASRFSVVTNSRAGYSLEFHPVGTVFDSVQVGGLGNVVQLSGDGGAIVLRGPLPRSLEHELSFRFNLSAQTLPGSYPWPLQLSVRALI